VLTRLPGMPERTQNEKGHSPASGAHANVATQDVSHILAMQQNAPLPLADSSVFAALSQPDVGVANVANLIDIPGAASNAPRLASFSYFANRGPANQVDGQVRLQPRGLVAIMHTTTHTSHVEIKKETETKDLCCAYDVGVHASHDEIEEEMVQSVETKSPVTHSLSETTTLLDTQPSTPANWMHFSRMMRRRICATSTRASRVLDMHPVRAASSISGLNNRIPALHMMRMCVPQLFLQLSHLNVAFSIAALLT